MTQMQSPVQQIMQVRIEAYNNVMLVKSEITQYSNIMLVNTVKSETIQSRNSGEPSPIIIAS
jgi:hypothetical protein